MRRRPSSMAAARAAAGSSASRARIAASTLSQVAWRYRATMHGRPKRSRWAAFKVISVACSAAIRRSKPSRPCSPAESGVSALAAISLPASSGCAAISRICASGPASRTRCISVSCRARGVWNGRCAAIPAITQSECSNKSPSSAAKLPGSASFSAAILSGVKPGTCFSAPNGRRLATERLFRPCL